jgi:D-cysteine desulfhydrase
MSIDRKTTKEHSALELFTNIPRFRLVNLNTPVERLDRLRQAIPGAPQLWIKRDDLTGYLGGGNKLRKLEYVMADALARGATTIVTTGSITSNLARTTALIARRLGLKCELILSGGDPKAAHANWRIAELLGVKIHTVASSKDRARRMKEVAEALEHSGERVYVVPLGASNEVGSFGMVAAFEELGIQQLEIGEQFDAIVFATSSGGTQAGLEVGKRLFNYRNLRLLGVSADDPADTIRESVLQAVGPMLSLLDQPEFPATTSYTSTPISSAKAMLCRPQNLAKPRSSSPKPKASCSIRSTPAKPPPACSPTAAKAASSRATECCSGIRAAC